MSDMVVDSYTSDCVVCHKDGIKFKPKVKLDEYLQPYFECGGNTYYVRDVYDSEEVSNSFKELFVRTGSSIKSQRSGVVYPVDPVTSGLCFN